MKTKREYSINKKYMHYLYDAMMGFFAYQSVAKTLEVMFPKVNSIGIIINFAILTIMFIFRKKVQKFIEKVEIIIKERNGKKQDETKQNKQ